MSKRNLQLNIGFVEAQINKLSYIFADIALNYASEIKKQKI